MRKVKQIEKNCHVTPSPQDHDISFRIVRVEPTDLF